MITCSQPECVQPVRCSGFCVTHYSRWRRGTPLDNPKKQVNKGLTCNVCSDSAFCKGLCQFHDQRRRLGIPLDAPKPDRDYSPKSYKCCIQGCFGLRLAKGLCSKHWQRKKAGIPPDLPTHFNWIYTTGWRTRDKYKKLSIRGREYLEHILIAERVLGRQLKPNEVVHHRDEDKTNNQPDNLEVMTRSAHTLLHNAIRRARRLERKMLCMSQIA